MSSRRSFIHTTALASLSLSAVGFRAKDSYIESIIPKALKQGDTIGLVCPAHPLLSEEDYTVVEETLAALGFKILPGKHIRDRYGYLAGKDTDRAADINAMFADSSVDAILAIHGGWGCARILPLLNYDLIRKNPKVFIGYSDLTALLNGIYAKTGLITFHGPVATSTWNEFTVENFKKVLMNGGTPILENPKNIGEGLAQTSDRIQTITPGTAQGILIGGNLTVFSAIVGSTYLPDFKDKILFLEDIGEDIYRIDRMLTQLKLAGILNQIKGFIWGKCTDCNPSKGYGSLTFDDIFSDHIKPLRIPAFSGSMIGHIKNKFTVPIGIRVSINAGNGQITLLESAVKN